MARDETAIGRTAVAGGMDRGHFALLFAAMLVAAAGNTALQSVMPAIGRELRLSDLWVSIAYTWSALLWVLLAPTWARMSDTRGRKPLVLMGVGAFVVSMALCGLVLWAGLEGVIGGTATLILFALCRAIYGALGSATPSAVQAYVASRTSRAERTGALSSVASSFSLGTIVGPALAPLLVLPLVGFAGPVLGFSLFALVVALLIWRRLPNDAPDAEDGDRAGVDRGRGAAMSYPSLATPPTGASVVASASDRPARLSWRDRRILPWLAAGAIAGHAQAATLTPIGFLVIDRLALQPRAAQPMIAIVMMAGAAVTLLAQWGIIPRLKLSPRGLLLWGAAVAAAGLLVNGLATNLYGITLGFMLASLGFGLARPGFTAGASLAVPQSEQGAVAGTVTATNGLAFIAAPALGVWLYGLWQPLPYVASAVLCLALIAWGWRGLGGLKPSLATKPGCT